MSAPRLAVVTGASSGIGRATALRLAGEGWRVVLVARDRARLDDVADRIATFGGQAEVEALDASDPAAVAAMADRVRDRHGPPGAVVNSAGSGRWAFLEDTPPAEMERFLDAPFRAAYHTTHAFLADMLARGAGVVVHVGSPAAISPWPGATGYTVSRWALRGLHESLAVDLPGTGVHSCHVVFGEVSSGYWAHNPGTAEARPSLARFLPTITPEECAEVIVRTLEHPRPDVVHPPVVAVLARVTRVVPWAGRALLVATGQRRR